MNKTEETITQSITQPLNRIKKFKNLFLILLSILFIASCQSNSKKTSSNELADFAHKNEINQILKSMTATAIQNQDYDQARKGIFGLLISDDLSHWEFIQSAIFSLPREDAISFTGLAVQHKSVLNSSEKLFQLSKVYISLQEQDLALKTVNQAIEKDAKNLDARFWRARLYTVKKDYEKAEIDFDYVIKKAPKNQEYKEQFASFLQEIEQFDKAQGILSELTPTPENLFKSIVFSLQNKNLQKANQVFEELLQVEVEESKLDSKHFLVAEAAYWLEKYQISKEHYSLVKGGDGYLDSRQMLTHILFDEKNYDEAIELLHQLQNAEVKYAVKAYLLESEIYRLQEKLDNSLDTLNMSLELIPNNIDLLNARAMIYIAQDKKLKGIKDLRHALELAPMDVNALNALGYTLADFDMNLEEALDLVTKAIELDPENAAIIDSLGWVHFKLGNYQEAETQLNKAMTKDLNDLEIYLHLHQTQLKLNKNEEAAKTLEQANELFPEDKKLEEYISNLK
jgi:tetratricopeptide (TPR) repeat protein